jgi:hypothetical protein
LAIDTSRKDRSHAGDVDRIERVPELIRGLEERRPGVEHVARFDHFAGPPSREQRRDPAPGGRLRHAQGRRDHRCDPLQLAFDLERPEAVCRSRP